jgi:flagellar biosynthesis/type III secretory pathway protein FliH
VKLASSVIREELSMGKSKIVNMVNEEIGRVVILDIVFV